MMLPNGQTVTGPQFTPEDGKPPETNTYVWEVPGTGEIKQVEGRLKQDANGNWVPHDLFGNALPETAVVRPGTAGASLGASMGVDTEWRAKRNELGARMELGNRYLPIGDPRSDKLAVPNTVQYYLALPKDEGWWTQLASLWAAGDETLAFMASAQQFLTAVLRLDSGAAVPITEYPQYYAQFIPMPGDGPQTLRRKAEARAVALGAIRASANGQGASPDELLLKSVQIVGKQSVPGMDPNAVTTPPPAGADPDGWITTPGGVRVRRVQ
jgi:hypothetical protein